ncbi:MAG TPA: tyrosine-type recombinase/integrase [Candidatus Baltobacteraceae bacterium]|jgi:integrase|nr:tyrosine-type recombinase/integrase [Candidatus Baltobacteraceae bacterium]
MKGSIKKGRVVGSFYLRVELDRGAKGKRRRMRETFRGSRREAEARLRDLLRESETGGLDGARISVQQLCDRWLQSTEHRVSGHTFVRYKQLAADYILPELGGLRARDMRPVHIESAVAKWLTTKREGTERTLSPRSVKHVFDVLRSVLNWGVRMSALLRNPVDAVETPRYVEAEMKTLDAEGIARLLRAASTSYLRLPIAVLIGTGVRRGECLGLKWGDIDFDAARVTIRRTVELVKGQVREKPPKTARSARTLALAPFVVAALREQKALQGEVRMNRGMGRATKDDYVFDRSDRPGELRNPDTFGSRFYELIRRKKLPKIRLHDLRHSFASLSLVAGADLKLISSSLGHSTIAITANTYLHLAQSLQEKHAAQLDSLVGGAVAEALAAGPGHNGPTSPFR